MGLYFRAQAKYLRGDYFPPDFMDKVVAVQTPPRYLGTLRDMLISSHRLWPALLALLLAIAAQVITAWNAHSSLVATNELSDQRSRTRILRMQLDRMLSLLKDVESGSRGFVITGSPEFLEFYTQAVEEIPRLHNSLRASIEKATLPGIDWAALDGSVQSRIGLAREVIALRQAGEDPGKNPAMFDSGRLLMNRIRADVAAKDAQLQQRISGYDMEIAELRRNTERLSWGSAGASFVLVAIATILALREQYLRRRLEEELRVSNQALEQRVKERTYALIEVRDRIASFSREQTRAVETERQRLSREVHDQIGQVFTAIKLIANSIPKENYLPGQAKAMAEALEMGILSTRRVTAALRPPLLDDLGLGAALQHMVDELTRATSLNATVDVRDEECLEETQRLGLFRIAQEAVTNVLRHARASDLRISGGRAGGDYTFVIADNGLGFDPEVARAGSFGLTSMQERAALIHADCAIESSKAGTSVVLTLPLVQNARFRTF